MSVFINQSQKTSGSSEETDGTAYALEVIVEWADGVLERKSFRGYQELGAWAEMHHGEYDGFRVIRKGDKN